ncbi:hypothetical protein J6590_084679 [Homalodisca vitripennis]|nr:hypothetical protein J6590_084679 [Homalodisca vitripennis]
MGKRDLRLKGADVCDVRGGRDGSGWEGEGARSHMVEETRARVSGEQRLPALSSSASLLYQGGRRRQDVRVAHLLSTLGTLARIPLDTRPPTTPRRVALTVTCAAARIYWELSKGKRNVTDNFRPRHIRRVECPTTAVSGETRPAPPIMGNQLRPPPPRLPQQFITVLSQLINSLYALPLSLSGDFTLLRSRSHPKVFGTSLTIVILSGELGD